MIIIKQPKFNICTCGRCGTVFQPETGDVLWYAFRELMDFDIFIRCPTCDCNCEVTVSEDAADTNVGHKNRDNTEEIETATTNFDRIKNMSVEELADFICDIYASNEHAQIRVDGNWMFYEDVEEWLEREVDT